MQFRVQRAIERPLTPSQSSDRRIDVHVIFKRFQPYDMNISYRRIGTGFPAYSY